MKDGEGVPDRSERPESFDLSYHLRTVQSMEVEGAATPVRMLDGPILLYLTRSSQCRKLTLSAP